MVTHKNEPSLPDGRSEPDVDDGDAPRVFRPQRALPTDVVRPTRAEVNLDHLRHNLGVLRRAAGTVPIWGVLKADAYGHGSKAVARTLERAGMDGICVALVEEGVELREAGLKCPILVMGGYYGDAYREMVHFGLTPVLASEGQLEAISRAAASDDRPISVHVKVDTGMSRIGATKSEWHSLAARLAASPSVVLDALMTHLASADHAALDVLDEPLARFEEASRAFASHGVRAPRRHMANSAAVLRDARLHFDLVRPGLALFGYDPLAPAAPHLPGRERLGELRPVMSLSSRVVAERVLAVGETVGYGGTFVARRPTKIVTVPVGYADGLSRALSNRGFMLVRGKRAPIAGIVSMDMTTLDVTDIEGATVGDEVVVLGAQRYADVSDRISAEELASWSGTIAWEVLTNVSRRVPRFYREP